MRAVKDKAAVVYRSPWYELNGYRARLVRLADGKRTTELEHRVVVESALGRKLLPGEHVHHLNEVRSDNRPENLQVLSKSEHARVHFATGRTMVDLSCQGCGAGFTRDVRRRHARYCSGSCKGRAGGRASGCTRSLSAARAVRSAT